MGAPIDESDRAPTDDLEARIPRILALLRRHDRVLALLLAAAVAGAVVAGVSLAKSTPSTSTTAAGLVTRSLSTTAAPAAGPSGIALQNAVVRVVRASARSLVNRRWSS
jgi:hypothetical protein